MSNIETFMYAVLAGLVLINCGLAAWLRSLRHRISVLEVEMFHSRMLSDYSEFFGPAAHVYRKMKER